jgi:hypothetical protein
MEELGGCAGGEELRTSDEEEEIKGGVVWEELVRCHQGGARWQH